MEDCYSMKFEDEADEQSFDKFNNVLFSLDSELSPAEKNVTKQQIYRRLSEHYVSAPKVFTKKLITILEESVINSTLNMSNNSITNFEKISKELQGMCDYLENESMPEQLLFTTINSSPSKEISKIIMEDDPTEMTFENHCSELSSTLTLNTDSCKIKTPSTSTTSKKVYRKTPRSIFKSEMKRIDDIMPSCHSPSKYNNVSFESLEAYCEKLFPDEKQNRTSVQTLPDSTLLSMDHIHAICEQQLASLDSPSDIKVLSQNKNEDSVIELPIHSKDVICHSYNKSDDSICEDKDRDKKLKMTNGKTYKVNLGSEYIRCTDELDKTLLSEIAKKRRRCFDTVKKMIDFNSECDTMEVNKESKADYKSTCDVNSNKLQNDIAKFLKILMPCKDYHDYLENQLPMLNAAVSPKTLVMETKVNKTSKKDLKIDLSPHKNKLLTNQRINSKSRRSKSYTENYRKILARWNIDSGNKEEKAERVVNKPNLFVTPGKTLAKNKRMRRAFFADVCTPKKQRSPLRTAMNRNK